MTITIRRASPKDAAAVAQLMADPAVYPGLLQMPYASEERWHTMLSESQAAGKLDLLLVAESNGELVGQAGLAIQAFEEALKGNPDSVPVLNGLAVAYDRLGRGEVSQRYLDRALTLDPDSVVTLNNLAYLNLVQGNTAVAQAYAERANTLINSEPQVLVMWPPNAVHASFRKPGLFTAAVPMMM